MEIIRSSLGHILFGNVILIHQTSWRRATFCPGFNNIALFPSLRRSFIHNVSFWKSLFFSPKTIHFLPYSQIRNSHVPEIWPIQGLISKLVDCILFKIIVQHVYFVEDKGTCGSGERNVKISSSSSEVSQIYSHFALKSTERKVMPPYFTNCGEPCACQTFLQ